ncbi:Hypothetical predicted protein [Paramuricea clavata]|uniref:Reverse transcriptase zinc-binding domain-containing protein n=1 Tax=Paramuricea clavata TaxID=317549 RepID=A0A6S7IGV5_PARCT|nr:Hypothetical predicted protein [Paramuricea clavata]
MNHSTSTFNSLWSSVQSKLPKNIFNFTIRYINNTLPTRKNLSKWGLSSTSDCSFCSSPETLLHVIAGCKTYLDEGRFTWRHDSVLNFLASTLTAVKNSTLYADIPGFMNPSVITGDRLRPDLLLVTENRCLYILELTVGYESNLQVNANRKRQKYRDLINEQEADYDKVNFVNLSLSTFGVFGRSSENFDGMLSSLKCDAKYSKYIKKQIVNICIRTYYVFSKRNKHKKSKSLLVCVSYRPPDSPLDCFEKYFKPNYVHALTMGKLIILLGDLNCDMLKPTPGSASLIKTTKELNLNQLIKSPTKITESSQTLVDVIFVSSPRLVVNSGVIETCISDHFPVYVSLKLKTDKSPPNYITTRSYNKYDPDLFAIDLASNRDRLVSIFRMDNVDEKLTIFNEIFLNTLDKHDPVKSI